MRKFREATAQGLTPAQVTAITAAIHELDASPYGDALYDAMTVLVEAGWANAADVFDVEAVLSDQSVPAWALAAVKGNAKQLAFMVVERERAALHALLEAAIADGSTAADFADDLQTFFADGYHVAAPAGVSGFDGANIVRTTPTKSWSITVARTELSRAANIGSMAFYHAAAIAQIQWIAADGVNTCPECADADEEIVDIGDSFPFVDVEHPPAHPRCACGVIPADADLGDYEGSDEDRDRAARGGYSAEDYEAKFGEKHPVDVRDDDADVDDEEGDS